ncbi:MAG TPA: hypothetical protein VGN79_11480 [Devosia sp.]|nr:hypothetical protein [Devosia sp.]
MTARSYVEVSADDVWGAFRWAERPQCSCGELARAVEEGLIFVSDQIIEVSGEKSNRFYLLPVQGDGFFALSEGVAIDCCPWCGDRVIGRKLRSVPAPGLG